ncbi:MAG: hypothetical protein FJZ67_03930 [Bacteroidetes bacterium]|nr:hypothetical protein [Bacteroidota bacterium]
MSEQELNKIESQLVAARKSGLLKLNETSLQSHGKLVGMDVFSWIYPNFEVLNSTLNSFPFEVLWIGNKTEINLVLSENNVLDSRVRTKLVYADGEELNVILKSMTESAFKPGILMFTSTDTDSEYYFNLFKEYLALVQLK